MKKNKIVNTKDLMTTPKFVVTILVNQSELIDLMNYKHGEVWMVLIAKGYEDYLKSLSDGD